MGYAFATLWYERQRFLPGILAVTFSAVLIALQCGLLLGLFSITSIPIDHTRADVWIGSPRVSSVDIGERIPEQFAGRLANCPELEPPEIYVQGFSKWTRPDGGSELCIVIGCRLEDNAIGSVDVLTPEYRRLLTQEGAIVVDEAEFDRLGISGVGDRAEILGHKVQVVGTVKGLKSLAGPYIFCSIPTARPLIRHTENQCTYLLARTRTRQADGTGDPAEAEAAVQRLNALYDDMTAFTAPVFSYKSQMHWLTKTRAGIALGYAAILGLLVGAVVTSQTLFAATMASMREYAILLALGIPRWRLGYTVVVQAFWVGLAGTLLALPVIYFLKWLAAAAVPIKLPWWLLTATGGVTMVMAVVSGLAALRSLKFIEPVNLLR
jgi:putative ABC transport system permease protein